VNTGNGLATGEQAWPLPKKTCKTKNLNWRRFKEGDHELGKHAQKNLQRRYFA